MDKPIKMGPTDRVECFETELKAFMSEVFGFAPGSYLVTDGSRLVDFFPTGLSSADIDQAQTLKEAYDAWDAWVLALIEGRYGVRPEKTTVLLADLLWLIGQNGMVRAVH